MGRERIVISYNKERSRLKYNETERISPDPGSPTPVERKRIIITPKVETVSPVKREDQRVVEGGCGTAEAVPKVSIEQVSVI